MARGLISAWLDRRRGRDIPAPPPFDFIGPPGSFDPSLENVIDTDNSVEVDDVEAHPWRPLCMLRAFPDRSYSSCLIGSGVLIRPDVILTAAHNVYRLETQSYVACIEAYVGRNRTGAPRALAYGVTAECPAGYIACRGPRDARRYAYDFAVIRLDTTELGDWAGRSALLDVPGQAPLSDAAMSDARLTVAGYPSYRGKPISLRRCVGGVEQHETRAIFYRMDTMPGESGGPVFLTDPASGAMRLAGVHTTGGERANRARRYDGSMRTQIGEWLGKPGGATLVVPSGRRPAPTA